MSTRGQQAVAYAAGELAHSGGRIAVDGDAQVSRWVGSNKTVNTAAGTIVGIAGSSGWQWKLREGMTAIIEGRVAGRATDGETAVWTFTTVQTRAVGATTPAKLGTDTITKVGGTAGTSGWAIQIVPIADSTFGLRVVGDATRTVHWVANVTATTVIA